MLIALFVTDLPVVGMLSSFVYMLHSSNYNVLVFACTVSLAHSFRRYIIAFRQSCTHIFSRRSALYFKTQLLRYVVISVVIIVFAKQSLKDCKRIREVVILKRSGAWASTFDYRQSTLLKLNSSFYSRKTKSSKKKNENRTTQSP